VTQFVVDAHLAKFQIRSLPFCEADLKEFFSPNEIHRCRFAETILCAAHLSISFQNRADTQRQTESYIISEERITEADQRDKSLHSLGVMTSLSGFGKTRFLLELPRLFSHHHHWKWIYMTYTSDFTEDISEFELPSARTVSSRGDYSIFIFLPNPLGNNF
jgi:hypothetical protein